MTRNPWTSFATTLVVAMLLPGLLQAAETAEEAAHRLAAVRGISAVTAIPRVKAAYDYLDGDDRRVAVIDIRVDSPAQAFEDAFKTAHSAVFWITENAPRWGAWFLARKPENSGKDWAREWRKTPARIAWALINIDYARSEGSGSFQLLWHPLGQDAAIENLAKRSAYDVVDVMIFNGANERAKKDIQSWCGSTGRRLTPRFCFVSLVNLCRGYLSHLYVQECRSAGIE